MARSPIGKLKFNEDGIGDVLNCDAVKSELRENADRIVDTLNGGGNGEFRAFESKRGTRARTYVDAWDYDAKHAVNKDPAILSRAIGGF